MKILLKSAYKNYTLDNYEQGEIGETETFDLGVEGRIYDSLNELIDDLYLSNDKENWMAYDEGRIICSIMENANSGKPSEKELKDFKEGLIDLYASEYNFLIEFIETHTPSVEEIVEKLEIESYD